jgi:hypothetical protein
LSIFFLFLIQRTISEGPRAASHSPASPQVTKAHVQEA